MGGIRIKHDHAWHYRPLLWLVLLFVVLFFVWASLSEIEQHVRAEGRIIPVGQSKTVQHLEGGIVNEILVKEGQTVEKGDVLLQVSNQRARSDLEEQKIALEALNVRLVRLRAEADGKEVFTYMPKQNVPQIKNILASEKQLFKSRRQGLIEKISILEEQAKQKSFRLAEMNVQYKNLNAERRVAQDQLTINDRLRKSGAISESRYLETKSRVRSFDTRIAQVKQNLPVIRAELQEIRQKIQSERENNATEVIEEMNKVELALRQLQERMKTGFDEVQRTEILSPTKGIINTLHVNTRGGVVRPGDPLVEIIPLDGNLIAEARVQTKDRGLIWNNLPVVVKITAYDFAVYGGIDGRIQDISADSFIDERGGEYYRVRVSLDRNDLGDDRPLYPGMTVEANIISGETTVLRALLKPFWRVQQAALRAP